MAGASRHRKVTDKKVLETDNKGTELSKLLSVILGLDPGIHQYDPIVDPRIKSEDDEREVGALTQSRHG